MLRRIVAAALMTVAATLAAPVGAQVVITQATALAGNVTPGDAPGFPVTITRADSYKLGTDLQPGTFEIKSPNVTLDLNGFSLLVGGAAPIAVNGFSSRQVTIENGAINNPIVYGITGEQSRDWTIRNVTITGFPDGAGIRLAGPARISDVTLSASDPRAQGGGPTSFGIYCSGCMIRNSFISAPLGVRFAAMVVDSTIVGTGRSQDPLPIAISSVGGYGNNTITGKVENARPLQSNVCSPACP